MKNQNKKGKSFYLDFEDEKTFSNFLTEQIFKIDNEIFLNHVHLRESGWAGESENILLSLEKSSKIRDVLFKIKSRLDRKYY